MKTIFYTITGLLLATFLSWAGLFAWAGTHLHPNDSLWDRDPGAMRLFFLVWAGAAVVMGGIGGWLAVRKQKRHV